MLRLVLLKFFESYFRHRWLYLLPMVIMSAVGVAFIMTSPVKYTSTATLYVEKQSLLASLTATQTDGSWWLSPAQITINEINELMSTKSFVRSAIQRTSLEAQMGGGTELVDQTISDFRGLLWLQPLGDKLVQIGANSEDPRLAQEVVNATLDAYVQWKVNTEYQESVVAQNFFANLIKPYQDNLDRTRDDLTIFLEMYPEPIRGERPPEETMELERLQAEVRRAEERVQATLNNEEEARLSQAKSESVTRQTYMMIDMPEPPSEPKLSLRETAQNMIIFFGIGFVVSFGAIVFAALFDRTIRFPVDAYHALSLRVLAMVPVAKAEAPVAVPVHKQRPGEKPEVSEAPGIPELQP